MSDDGYPLTFEIRHSHRDGHAVWLDDDGKTGYAFYRIDEKIVGDVWIYNVGETPDIVNWRDKSLLPFPNPSRYCNSKRIIPRISEETEFRVQFHDTAAQAGIFFNDLLVAIVEADAYPGWSILSREANPLAQPLQAWFDAQNDGD